MRKILIKAALLCLLVIPANRLFSQVTIGSLQNPVSGALLDLKQEADGSSSKGMVLPRVELTDVNNLYPMFEGTEPDYAAQKEMHVGLLVYNVSGQPASQCAPIPNGLYVWDGKKWRPIGIKEKTDQLLFSLGTDIDFPSGIDLRPMPTIAKPFAVNWKPLTSSVTYSIAPDATWGGINFNSEGTPPASGTLNAATLFQILPNAMTAADIESNPFRTKKTLLTFKLADDCGNEITEVRAITQTNKALTVQNQLHEVETNGIETNQLKSNAQWRLKSIEPNDQTNAIFNDAGVSSLMLDGRNLSIGSVNGEEKNDNEGREGILSYDVTVGLEKTTYNKLTFEDASSVKRFEDVTLTILQCPNENLRVSQWASFAGFPGVADIKLSEDDDIAKKRDQPHPVTGIAWHRDQSGNVFLSSSFHPSDIVGDSERWMITNLAATRYADGVVHSIPENQQLTGPDANRANSHTAAVWAYPNGGEDGISSATYDNDNRIGLLYTWDAATAGKGGADGRGNVDNPGIVRESGFREGTAVNEQKRRQGICPSGWHLPSDDEWSVLEQIMVNYKSTFSLLPTSVGEELIQELTSETMPYGVNRPVPTTQDQASTPNTGRRGLTGPNGHANAMKEICAGRYYDVLIGSSNPIGTTVRPGFLGLFAGTANRGVTNEYGVRIQFWTSSLNAGNAWTRTITIDSSQVGRVPPNLRMLSSVRCKKDN